MSNGKLAWRCIGPDDQWCARLEELLPGAGVALELSVDFSHITICADDTPEEESCWFKLEFPDTTDDTRTILHLFCSTRSFAKLKPMQSTVFPSTQIWEPHEGSWKGEDFNPLDFSIERAEIFLYHNLMLARDLARDEISLSSINSGQVEAFEAAWEVVVDGRLARAGWPGYSLSDRRGMFSRLFSSAGVLMPDHWQIFQSLWDGGLPSGRDVLAIIRQLPRL